MKYDLSTRGITVSDEDRDLLDAKFARLEKYIQPPFQTTVRFVRDAHHESGNIITCVVNIAHGKTVFHAERSAASIQDALDEVLEALATELKKFRDKEIEAGRERKRLLD